MGLVVPRGVIADAGNEAWRRAVLDRGRFADVVTVVNKRGWAFEQIHYQYTIAFVSVQNGRPKDPVVRLAGPFANMKDFLANRFDAVEADIPEFESWSQTASFPLLPTSKSGNVFRKMRMSPRLDVGAFGGEFRAVSELNARNDKHHFILEPESQDGLWPVYSGGSINIWLPDTGDYYAWSDPSHIKEVLAQKRLNQSTTASSAFGGLRKAELASVDTLPCNRPRIAYRLITNRTNRRTVITSLTPPAVVLQHGIPYLLRKNGDERSEAALLGVLSSIPLDWFARRYVELNLLINIVHSLPIPVTDETWLRRLVEIAGRLASPDDRFKEWATAVGVECGPLEDDTKNSMINELDALVAKAYGLDRDDLIHIFETFHEGWDYKPRLDATLEHFDRL